ncbi:MAG: PEP-CTERM sorting domain-containing protein [Planctomycetota bacterium]
MMKKILAAIAAAMFVSSATAQVVTNGQMSHHSKVSHYNYDFASGAVTPATSSSEEGPGVAWDATMFVGSFWNGGANTGIGGEDVDWGDVAPGTVVNGFDIGIASDSTDDIDLTINFYEPGDGFGDASALVASFPLTLPGPGDPINGGIFAATFTIDLVGSEFTLADGNFEYGYEYVNNGNGAATGPLLVALDPTNAPGTDDAWDQYVGGTQASGGTVSTFFFGGDPYAQFYMKLHTVPEPGTIGLLLMGSLFGFGLIRRR